MFSQRTKNDDLVIRIKVNEALLQAMPGQFVYCSFCRENITGNTTVKRTEKTQQILAHVFSVNPVSHTLELYIQASALNVTELDKLENNTVPDYAYVSELQGESFVLPGENLKPILFADDAGLPSIVYLALKISESTSVQPLVILTTESQFSFTPKPSQFVVSDLPPGMLATCPLLEDKKIPARLISETFKPGCYEGRVEEFLEESSGFLSKNNNAIFYVSGSQGLVDILNQCASRYGLAIDYRIVN